jgi:hypothetical protein
MHFLPQQNQLVKIFRRRSQNLTHVTAFCVAWANAVGPIGECDISIDADINDNFGLSRKTMNVTRLMVLWISDEPDIAETKRCHALEYNPSDLGYQAPADAISVMNEIWLRTGTEM